MDFLSNEYMKLVEARNIKKRGNANNLGECTEIIEEFALLEFGVFQHSRRRIRREVGTKPVLPTDERENPVFLKAYLTHPELQKRKPSIQLVQQL